jgi:hypothetical protein
MTTLRLSGFLGENRAIQPMLLPEGVGTVSTNQKPGRGDLRPWKAPATVATVPAGRKTIYRMGRTGAQANSDTDFWLSWPQDVHLVLGGNAKDTSERTYYTGSGADGLPRWTDLQKATPVQSDCNVGSRLMGIPAPGGVMLLAASGGTSPLTETRFYTYTYVTDIGEEGAPNPQPVSITCKTDATVTLSGMAEPGTDSWNITQFRVYRTQDGQTTAGAFYEVATIASNLTSHADVTTTLGSLLATTDWLPAPGILMVVGSATVEPVLTNLTGLWNGMMAGISGRAVRFCQAWTYYAWPFANEVVPTNSTPVALATFGQTLVVLTDGNPSVITGGSPESMDEQPVEFYQSCIAPKSAVGMGHGVAWASPDGLAYIGQGGARMLTEGTMTRDDWQALVPSEIIGCMYERRYFGFYSNGTKAFIVDPTNPQGIYFLDFGAVAVYLDDTNDTLYTLSSTSVQKFDAGAAKTVTFKSKVSRLPKHIAGFSFAKVVGSYPATFKLYTEGVLKHTHTVVNDLPFPLPGGYRANNYQIEVSTTGDIQMAAVANSLDELVQS